MKVLLLHPEDKFPPQGLAVRWDLIVDLGRAPSATYERWSRQARCETISLFQSAAEIGDLGRLRELLQLGMNRMVDRLGIDWWDLLCLFIAGDLQQLMLVHRLSKELRPNCDLYSSRPHPLSTALQRLLGARLTILESRWQSVIHRARHYCSVVSHSDPTQLAQMFEDKFDGEHSIRRRFSCRQRPRRPVILLPSAYINVSRTALAYAEMLPDHQFLLVRTRCSAKVRPLPPNVRSASLSPYFVPSDNGEIASLVNCWESLRKRLVDGAAQFSTADAAGILGRIPLLLPWGIALRDAWCQLFESEDVTACLSADDSNPPSSIPLILAKKRGLPSLASHHGALDSTMAVKVNHADFYLVKSEMERDYLRRICQLASEKIAIAAPAKPKPSALQRWTRPAAPWLVFFSEPYQSYWWRRHEVYRDLLPRLCALAQSCGLKLVFKLHPFESVKGHRKMLRQLLPEQEPQIEVLAGPPSDQLWNNIQFALTVQSSTALECAARGIPVFLCAWLRDPYSGYVPQYARFGVGQVLDSSEQIANIPRLLANQNAQSCPPHVSRRLIEADKLVHLFSGSYSLPVASNA
jgi:hypothetical protein